MFDEALCKDCASQRYSGTVLTRYVYRCLTDNLLGKSKWIPYSVKVQSWVKSLVDGRPQRVEV